MSIGRARPKALVACIFVDSGFVSLAVKGFEQVVFFPALGIPFTLRCIMRKSEGILGSLLPTGGESGGKDTLIQNLS